MCRMEKLAKNLEFKLGQFCAVELMLIRTCVNALYHRFFFFSLGWFYNWGIEHVVDYILTNWMLSWWEQKWIEHDQVQEHINRPDTTMIFETQRLFNLLHSWSSVERFFVLSFINNTLLLLVWVDVCASTAILAK